MHADQPISAEEQRLVEARQGVPWREWGPYLSERQWGTVREDYSDNGDAWSYFSHDEARSRAYRWGEDGIAGISDDQQRMCFAIALWNERDPIIKERLFGLTNAEGNHGEDVKEYYFYVDNLPSHAYQQLLYKYPQREYPYSDLVSTNAARIMGLYPKKGAIAVGSDADITVLDPTRRGKVRAADLHETDYTPWEGHDIFAWPVVTILRGKVMVENGRYFASANDGRYLKRRIPSEILSGAAL